MGTKKYDVFISYSSQNEAEAVKIRNYLEKNGLSCWFAPAKIRGQQDFSKEIPQAIAASKLFLLLMSKSAQESKWVHRELGRADKCRVSIYTLFLEDFELNDEFDFILQFNQHYSLSKGRKTQLERLLVEMKEDIEEIDKKTDGENEGEEDKGSNDSVKSGFIKHRKKIFIAAALLIVFLIGVFIFIISGQKDERYIIWNPEYNIALSAIPAHNNSFYLLGCEAGDGKDIIPVEDRAECSWEIDFVDEDTVLISYNGQKLGITEGKTGVGLGGEFTEVEWELRDAGNGSYYIMNTQNDHYLNWRPNYSNWAVDPAQTMQDETHRVRFILKLTPIS